MFTSMTPDECNANDLVKLQDAAMPEKLILQRSRFELMFEVLDMFGFIGYDGKNKRSIHPPSIRMFN